MYVYLNVQKDKRKSPRTYFGKETTQFWSRSGDSARIGGGVRQGALHPGRSTAEPPPAPVTSLCPEVLDALCRQWPGSSSFITKMCPTEMRVISA